MTFKVGDRVRLSRSPQNLRDWPFERNMLGARGTVASVRVDGLTVNMDRPHHYSMKPPFDLSCYVSRWELIPASPFEEAVDSYISSELHQCQS